MAQFTADNFDETAYQKMLSSEISLSFKGAISFELIDSIMGILADKLETIEINTNVRKKVFGVLTECLQNMCHHTESNAEPTKETKFDLKSVKFSVDTENASYKISSGNFIKSDKVKGLTDWIDKINEMSAPELKELYNSILLNKRFSDRGTAGLGFIDIARKTGNKIEYKSTEVDDKYSFFILSLRINKDK